MSNIQDCINKYNRVSIDYDKHAKIFDKKEEQEIQSGKRLQESHSVYQKHNQLTSELVAALHAILECPIETYKDLLLKLSWLKNDEKRVKYCFDEDEFLKLVQSFDPLLEANQ